MKGNVAVIVVRCNKDTVWGERLVDARLANLEDARALGETKRAPGMCVIVRPTYNETDDAGKRFYREWRSFNGEPFKECRWSAFT